MDVPTVIVFEKQPRWTPELQRQFDGEDVRVRACNSTTDLETLLANGGGMFASSRNDDAARGCVAVLHLETAPAECLQYLGRSIDRRLNCPVIVIGSKRTADLEWSVRELGALEFVADFISGEELARLCRRQLMLFETERD